MAESHPPIELSQISDDLRVRLAHLLGTVPLGIWLPGGPPTAVTPGVPGQLAAWEDGENIALAFAVELPDNTIVWVGGGVGGGGGGSTSGGLDVFMGTNLTTHQFGAIPPNTPIKGLKVVDIIEMATQDYPAPVFDLFYVDNYANGQILEIGTPFDPPKTFYWRATNNTHIKANSITIKDAIGNVNLFTGLPYTPSSATATVAGNWSAKIDTGGKHFQISGTNDKDLPFGADFVLYGVYPWYYGQKTTDVRPSTAAELAALIPTGMSVLGGSSGTISVPFTSGSGDYIWFAVPQDTSVTKQAWWQSALNNGAIGGTPSPGGNLFPSPVADIVVTTALWSTKYKVYVSNYRTSATTLEMRN